MRCRSRGRGFEILEALLRSCPIGELARLRQQLAEQAHRTRPAPGPCESHCIVIPDLWVIGPGTDGLLEEWQTARGVLALDVQPSERIGDRGIARQRFARAYREIQRSGVTALIVEPSEVVQRRRVARIRLQHLLVKLDRSVLVAAFQRQRRERKSSWRIGGVLTRPFLEWRLWVW